MDRRRSVGVPMHRLLPLLVTFILLFPAACQSQTPPGPGDATRSPALHTTPLQPGEKLRVVATTTIVADVVQQIGQDRIDLHTLFAPGVDPHRYTATPADLRALSDAHVVFINGLGLEEAIGPILEEFQPKTVAVNDGVEVRTFEASGQAQGDNVDPHTWFSVPAVKIWARNIAAALSELDPANADAYQAAADAYTAQLDALHAEIQQMVAQVPAERRKLVTDHDVFGYFAATYGFQIVATVIPSLSTLAEPSAQQLVALQEQVRREGVRAIFVGNTVNPKLAEELARDLGIRVVPVYTGSLSDPDGPAASYIDFMRTDVQAIVAALQ